MILTLAQDFFEIVAVSIGVIIMIGSAISQALKNKNKQPADAHAPSEKSASRTSMDELAAKRRQEMIAEAQRRRAQRQQEGRPTPDRPPTMAERMRQRGRAAAQGQSQQEQVRQAAARQQEAERRRRAAVEQERRRQLEVARQQQIQRQRQQQQMQPPVRRQRPVAPARPPQPTPRRTPPAQPPVTAPPLVVERSRLHRPARAASPEAAQVRRELRRGFSLRQAMIWKEILDKPVGLRDFDYEFPT